jgi:hypothetical protein
MRLLKVLPFILAGMHAVIAAGVFGMAISNPARSGLFPLVLYYIDYPCSILMESLRRSLHGTAGNSLVVDGLVYGIVGTLWFFLIGLLLRAVIERLIQAARPGAICVVEK